MPSPSSLVKTYDLTKCNIILDGLPIGGFAEGDAVTVEFEEDLYKKTVGSDGEVTRAKTNNTACMFTFNLLYSSDANALMQGLVGRDRDSGTGVTSLTIEDLSGGMKLNSPQVWVRKYPSVTMGQEMPALEWILDGGQTQVTFAGIIPPNLAG